MKAAIKSLAGVFLSFLTRASAGLLFLLCSIFIARLLGEEQAGFYFISFALLNFLSVFSRVGLDKFVLRSVSVNFSAGKSDLVFTAFIYSVIAVFFVSSFFSATVYFFSSVIASSFFLKPDLEESIRWVALAIPFVALSAIVSEAMQGMRKYIYALLVSHIFPSLFLLILLLIMYFCKINLTSGFVSSLMFFSYLIAFAFGIYFLFIISDPPFALRSLNLNDAISVCLPLYIVDVMAVSVVWGGQLISAHWLSAEDQAYISVAQRAAALVSLLLTSMNMVVAPRLATFYYENDFQSLRKISQLSTYVVIFMAFPVVLFMCIFPDLIMSVFNIVNERASTILLIFVIGQFLNAVTGPVGYLLSMTGHERDLRNVTLVSGVCAFALPLLVLPTWGVVGAAVSMTAALSVQNILALIYVRRRLGFWTFGFDGILR